MFPVKMSNFNTALLVWAKFVSDNIAINFRQSFPRAFNFKKLAREVTNLALNR